MGRTVALMGLLLSVAPRANAQDEATARARVLFSEGVTLTDDGNWAAAVNRFEEALELKDAPAIRYNLALALIELDRFQQAADHLAQAIADDEAGRIAEPAADAQADLQRRAARLTIRLVGAQGDETVFLDDEPVDADRVGSTLWLTPGSHVLIVQRGSRELARREVNVGRGQAGEASLEVVPAPGEAAAQAADTESPPDGPRVGPQLDEQQPERPEHAGAPTWAHWTALGSVAATVLTVFAVSMAN